MQLFAVNFIRLPGYSTCFGRFTYPSSGVQFQLYLQPPVQIIVSSQLTSSNVAWYRPHWKTLPEAVDTVEIVLLMMGV
jgi:hypothetical protein